MKAKDIADELLKQSQIKVKEQKAQEEKMQIKDEKTK